MNIILRLTVLAAGCVTFCQCDACVDKLPDCGEYTKSSCKAPYVNWAYNNCKAYCGFCHTECHDKRSDCHEYGKQVCQSPYIPWAKENCEQYCGFCGHGLKCVYSPWLDLTPCSPVCGRGKKVQVRTVAIVKPGTPLEKDCTESLFRNTACNINCTIKPTAVVKVPVTETLIVTDKTHVQEPVVDTGVLDHHGPLIHVDPDTVKDVAIAGAATGVAAAGRGEVYTENIVSGERTPFAEVTHKVLNKKTTGSKDKVLTLECRPTATTIEIKDKCDIVYGDFEFRVRRDILSDLKEASCSDGNFMWLLAKRLFHDEELVGRNFFGRKGRLAISPRRRNCLKAAFLEHCGSNYADFTKAVNSINNGIRSLRR